ncbi:ATP-binding protein [Pedobacter sp. UYP1]|uniref:ATP-binding protein n=1 Tax=Pedobacter sp. UYP1 TaxID=1756396 RepID=UPI0033988DD5
MKKIKLKRLKFDNHTIDFKNGINYIIGANASGKTTIFNLIQHILGIRKDLGFFSSFIKQDKVSLEITIDDVPYIFQRDLIDQEIIISAMGEDLLFIVGSSTFDNYLIKIFQPQYNFEIEKSYLASLLRESFISDNNNNLNLQSSSQKENKLLLMGINASYPKKIKIYIKELEAQIKQKKGAFAEIDAYRKDISFILDREFPEKKNTIQEILNGTLTKYKEQFTDLSAIYNESKIFLAKIIRENDWLFQEKMNHLEPIFTKYARNFIIDDRASMKDLFEGNYKGNSYGETILLALIFEIIIQSSSNLTNGIGLIINDSGLLHFDNHRNLQFRTFLDHMVQEYDLQYIEFSNSSFGFEKSEIVFDTTKNLRYV